ncbi:hypothetical protein GQX74_013524 [Glossina fuscipes]|nr:hypothetical protein GQX74_013524 [Glossina fuscipes]
MSTDCKHLITPLTTTDWKHLRVFLMTVKLYRKNIKPKSIGIITPYIKQAKQLRDLFGYANVAMPKIGSAEQFQGQKRDIILISTVRSNENYIKNDLRLGQGFIEQVNLAITRARSLVIIYGNPFLLMFDPHWRRIIKYCGDNDAYFDVKL